MNFHPTGVTSLVLELILLVGQCDKRGHPGEFYKVLVDGNFEVQCLAYGSEECRSRAIMCRCEYFFIVTSSHIAKNRLMWSFKGLRFCCRKGQFSSLKENYYDNGFNWVGPRDNFKILKHRLHDDLPCEFCTMLFLLTLRRHRKMTSTWHYLCSNGICDGLLRLPVLRIWWWWCLGGC